MAGGGCAVKQQCNTANVLNCCVIIGMQQCKQKREEFSRSIRTRQNQALFQKIRSSALLAERPHHELLDLIARLPRMRQISATAELILEHYAQLMAFVKEVRQFQQDPSILSLQCQEEGKQVLVLCPLLQYLLAVVTTAHQYVQMDIEQGAPEAHLGKQAVFSQLMLSISYLLMNMLSFQQQIPQPYLRIVQEFTQYRFYLDIFHNIFLCSNLSIATKQVSLRQYLSHLQENPNLYLNNCHIYTRVLYYACEKEPRLQIPQYQAYCVRTVLLLQKLCSILPYNDKLQSAQRNQFKFYCLSILSELCYKNAPMCRAVTLADPLMAELASILDQTRGLFRMSIHFTQDEDLSLYVTAVKLVQYLGYFNQMVEYINECYPPVWLHICAIYSKFSITHWMNQNKDSKSILPPVFQLPMFHVLVGRVLKVIANFICLPDLCYEFAREGWVRGLTELYNDYFKYDQVRVECLYIFSNCLLITFRGMKTDLHQTQYQAEQQSPQQQVPVIDLMHQLLSQSLTLVLECLKLANTHKTLLLLLINTLIDVLESMPRLGECGVFRDAALVGRVQAVAEGEGSRRGDYYDGEVRARAGVLWDALGGGKGG